MLAESLGIQFPGLDLVHIAPNPRFSRLNRADQRMIDFVKVFGRVFILGRVAASHMAARQAEAQMYPRVPHLHAFFADMLLGLFDFDLIEVSTLTFHDASW